MKTAFYHLAVGRFGSESLGKLAWLIREEQLDDPALHRFYWVGLGDRPGSDESSWDPNLPVWEFDPPKLALPKPPEQAKSEGLGLNRTALARHLIQILLDTSGDTSPGRILQWLWDDYLTIQFGHKDRPALHLTVCGSLAEPADSAIILGILRAFELLRQKGVAVPELHIVASTGEASSSLKVPQDLRRAMAARAALDLHEFFSQGKASERMAAAYLIGDRPLETGIPLDRPSQVALAAYTLLALAKDSNCSPEERPKLNLWPFRISRSGGQVFWGGSAEVQRPYNPARPLAVCGGYAAVAPAGRLARLLAARFCKLFFIHLAGQKSLGAPDGPFLPFYAKMAGLPPPPVNPDAVNSSPGAAGQPDDGFPSEPQLEFLRFLVNVTARTACQAMGLEAPSERPGGPPVWPQWQQLEQLAGRAEEDTAWGKLLHTYGDERFLKLPLDDWEQALSEFQTLVEEGFATRRQRRLAELARQLNAAILNGLVQALDTLFLECSYRTDLGLEPHRLAQALLGMVYANLSAISDDLERQRVQLGQVQGVDEAHEQLEKEKQRLFQAVSQVPSPVAVACRAGLFLSACIGLSLAVPLPAAFAWIPPSVPASLGAVIAGGITLCLLERAGRAKKYLLEILKAWLGRYRFLVLVREEERRKKAIEVAFANILLSLKGLWTGTLASPPGAGARQEQMATIHRLLRQYSDEMKATGDWFGKLEESLIQSFQASRIETYLPDISPTQCHVLDDEFARFLNLADAHLPPAKCIEVFQEMTAWFKQSGTAQAREESAYLPFLKLVHSKDSLQKVPAWGELWGVQKNVSALYRLAKIHPAVQFYFCLADRFWVERVRLKTLAERLNQDPVLVEETVTRFRQRSNPSMEIGGRSGKEIFRMFLESGANDPCAKACRNPIDKHNDLGVGRLTLLHQVQMQIAGDDAVFSPNEAEPTNLLGKAWSYYKCQLNQEQIHLPSLHPCLP